MMTVKQFKGLNRTDFIVLESGRVFNVMREALNSGIIIVKEAGKKNEGKELRFWRMHDFSECVVAVFKVKRGGERNGGD